MSDLIRYHKYRFFSRDVAHISTLFVDMSLNPHCFYSIDPKFSDRYNLANSASLKRLRTKVTPDLHLTYSKNGRNLGSESK